MSFTVSTHTNEDDLANFLNAIVETYPDEDTLAIGLENTFDVFNVLAKGGKFTVIDDPQIANISLKVVAKGGFFTVILEK